MISKTIGFRGTNLFSDKPKSSIFSVFSGVLRAIRRPEKAGADHLFPSPLAGHLGKLGADNPKNSGIPQKCDVGVSENGVYP